MLIQAQSERCRQWLSWRQRRARARRFLVNHQGAGGQIAEALEGWVIEATENAQAIGERQKIDKAQQVTGQGRGPADGRAVVMHHAQTQQLFAWRAALVEHLEQHHVPPGQQKGDDRTQAHAQFAEQGKGDK